MTDSKTAVDDGPFYVIPLDIDQLAMLGRFSATWSQLDFLIATMISMLGKLDPAMTYTLLDGMTTGPRLNLLNRLLPKIEDESLRKAAKESYKAISGLLEKRNHVTHGLWGLYFENSAADAKPAAYWQKVETKPLFADELERLSQRAAEQSRALGDVLVKLGAPLGVDPPRRFFFSLPSAPPPHGEPKDWKILTPQETDWSNPRS